MTPLLASCIHELWGLVPDLLKAGADPNVRLVRHSRCSHAHTTLTSPTQHTLGRERKGRHAGMTLG